MRVLLSIYFYTHLNWIEVQLAIICVVNPIIYSINCPHIYYCLSSFKSTQSCMPYHSRNSIHLLNKKGIVSCWWLLGYFICLLFDAQLLWLQSLTFGCWSILFYGMPSLLWTSSRSIWTSTGNFRNRLDLTDRMPWGRIDLYPYSQDIKPTLYFWLARICWLGMHYCQSGSQFGLVWRSQS